ncbi:MAG: signal peptidase II [Candidatus Pacebacteria bacterium]|nr:signal peptidase II [Candidatus Paceibacterota bacterium]
MIFLKYNKQQGFKMFLISLAVLFFDQIAKFFALSSFSGFYLHKNYEIFFGLPFYSHLIFLLFLFLVIVFKRKFLSKCDNTIIFSFSLLIGGIVSNTLDRALYGYVIDYLVFFHFFVFNFADLAIFFGLLIISWKIFRK